MNKFFIDCFYKFFFTYTKMSKNQSAKYYQDNKERLHKKLVKVFLKKKNKKSSNMVVNNLKIYQKRQKLVEYRKKCYKMRKTSYHNWKKLFLFEKIVFFLDREKSVYWVNIFWKENSSFRLAQKEIYSSIVILGYEKFFILCLISSHHKLQEIFSDKCEGFFGKV